MANTASDDALNVLFIGVDDLRPQLGCYGHSQMVTPHVDRLARDGILFARHYCQLPSCAPSRANVMSGCRPETTGVLDLRSKLAEAMPGALTLPQQFRQHGYETISVGKVYHRPSDDPQGWSREPYRYRGKDTARGYVTAEAIALAEQRNGRGPAFETGHVPDHHYRDGANTELAIEELERLRNRRFFLAMGYVRPHLPYTAPAPYWDLYDHDAIQLPGHHQPPQGVTPYSLTDFGELRQYANIPAAGPISQDLARQLIHGYYACVSYVDAQIGRLLTALQDLGLREQTLVVLWVDHGCKLGDHGSWGKQTLFEHDTRVPLVISPPGWQGAARRTAALSENVDIYGTVCQLCKLPQPHHLEGTSLVPLMARPDQPWKRAAFSQLPRGDLMGYALRTERYRYVEWQQRAAGDVVARELYDHDHDPAEAVNLAAAARHQELVETLAHRLHKGWQAARPEGF